MEISDRPGPQDQTVLQVRRETPAQLVALELVVVPQGLRVQQEPMEPRDLPER